MKDFATFSYTSTREIPTFSYTWPLKTGPLSKGIPPCVRFKTRISNRISVTIVYMWNRKGKKKGKLSCKNSYLLLLQNILNSVQTVKKFIVHCTLWKEYPSSNLALHSSFVDNAWNKEVNIRIGRVLIAWLGRWVACKKDISVITPSIFRLSRRNRVNELFISTNAVWTRQGFV